MRRLVWIVILIGLPAAGIWLWRARQVQAKADLPVASARKGEFQVIVRCRGELASTRSRLQPSPDGAKEPAREASIQER